MKTTLLAVAVLWVGAAVAQAPDTASGPGPGFHHESAAERLDHLAILLDLTDAQKPQVQSILEEQHAKIHALHEQAWASGEKPTFEQMKATHEQLKQETLAKLTPILTPAQLKKFQILMEEMHPFGGRHGGPH